MSNKYIVDRFPLFFAWTLYWFYISCLPIFFSLASFNLIIRIMIWQGTNCFPHHPKKWFSKLIGPIFLVAFLRNIGARYGLRLNIFFKHFYPKTEFCETTSNMDAIMMNIRIDAHVWTVNISMVTSKLCLNL